MNVFTYEQVDGMHAPPLVSKMVGIKIIKGQRLHLETPGGGGYGAAMERDPKAVVRDVAHGYVSVCGAARDYAVAITTDGVQDMEKTSELRKAAGQ